LSGWTQITDPDQALAILERSVFDLVPGELVSMSLILGTILKSDMAKSRDLAPAARALIDRIGSATVR
jgi:hypothetical protein